MTYIGSFVVMLSQERHWATIACTHVKGYLSLRGRTQLINPLQVSLQRKLRTLCSLIPFRMKKHPHCDIKALIENDIPN